MQSFRACLLTAWLLVVSNLAPAHAVLLELPNSLDYWQSSAFDTSALLSGADVSSFDQPEAPETLRDGANPIAGAPTYYWWNGCSPTSGGMLMAWWDAQAGRENLYDGNALIWTGDGTTGTRRMVASQEHIDAGDDLGLTYGSYKNHTANCIADFMYTENGGTYATNIIPGLMNYALWDDPDTALNESHNSSGSQDFTSYYDGDFTWDDFTAEIDTGSPMLLNMRCYYGSKGLGHTVFAYGYEQYDGLNWFAIKDTWSISGGSGNSDQSYWPEDGVTDNRLVDGVEWWPFFEFGGYEDPAYYAWRVYGGGMLEINEQPEPATMALFGLGVGAFVIYRRRRR